jgi:prefoldin subunit 5
MPVINEYFAGDLGLRPSEQGIDALQQAARRVGAFGSQRAEATSRVTQQLGRNIDTTIKDAGELALGYVEHKEMSQGGVAYAKTLNGLTNEYNAVVGDAMSKDPDTVEAVSGKFLAEKVEPALQDFGQAFNTEKGQKWADQRIFSLREHFTEKAQSDNVTAAHTAASRNLDSVVSTLTNTAYQDGHSVDQTLKDLPDLIHSQTSQVERLAGVKGAAYVSDLLHKSQVSIVAAGVKGAIERSSDPEATAQEWIKKYPEFINGAEAGSLAKAAKTSERFNSAQDRAAQLQQKQIDREASEDRLAQTFNKNVTVNPDGSIIIDPKAIAETKQEIGKKGATVKSIEDRLAWYETKLKQGEGPPPKSDTNALAELNTSLQNGKLDPMRVLQLDTQRKLSQADAPAWHRLAEAMQKEPIQDEGFKQAMKAVEGKMMYVYPGLTLKDPNGRAAYSAFLRDFVPEYTRKTNAHELGPNDLDLRKPDSWISGFMRNYIRDPLVRQQQMFSEISDYRKAEGTVPSEIPQVPQPKPSAPAIPIGTIKTFQGKDWRFKGGEQNKPGNWEEVK